METSQVDGTFYPPLYGLFRKINNFYNDLANEPWTRMRDYGIPNILWATYSLLCKNKSATAILGHWRRKGNETHRTTVQLVVIERNLKMSSKFQRCLVWKDQTRLLIRSRSIKNH